MSQSLRSLTRYFSERILSPDDPADVRLGKGLFVWFSLLVFPFGLIGMVIGLFGGSANMVAIGAFCAVVFPLNLVVLTRTGRFALHFSICVLGVMLVMLVWGTLLGGFRTNFSVYWAVFIPLVLVVLVARRRAAVLSWYVVFAVFTAAFSLLDPFVEDPARAPANVAMANTFTVLVTAGLTLLTIFYYKREKNTALHLLGIERERADALLLNILPRQIAETLKVEEGTIADHYESASILFADLVGFTPMSARMAPAEMIDLLNTIYSHFDTLADKYGVEKIRTIGDNYMVAAGVPNPRPDHAQALVCGLNKISIACLGRKDPKGLQDLWGLARRYRAHPLTPGSPACTSRMRSLPHDRRRRPRARRPGQPLRKSFSSPACSRRRSTKPPHPQRRRFP